MKKVKKINILFLMGLFLVLYTSTRGAITSVTLTPGNPTTLSNGRAYYLAGKTYNFDIQVIEPTATDWTSVTLVRLQMTAGINIDISINPTATGNDQAVTGVTANISALADITGTYNNFTVKFKVTFLWDGSGANDLAWQAGRTITANAIPATGSSTDTQNVSYGEIGTIRLLNFDMDGDGADGKVNPWHEGFSATGNHIIYNVTGATSADTVHTIADGGAGEITGTQLFINGIGSGSDADESDNSQTFAVAGSFFDTNGIANSTTARTVLVRASMTTGGATVDTSNSLGLICNEVEVTDIVFVNGGGIDSDPSNYFRSTGVLGTQVQVTVRMRVGLGVMEGNVRVELRDRINGNISTVDIPNGQNTGIVNLNITNYGSEIVANGTEIRDYEIYNIYDGAYGSAIGFGQYASVIARIQQPATHQIYWDNDDPPGNNGVPFTTGFTDLLSSQTADTVTVNWTALTAAGPPDYDADFDTYRIYYKQNTSATWLMIDRNTLPFATYGSLGTIGTGSFTVTGLVPLTTYDFILTSVDIFGNEVILANRPTFSVATLPSSLTITLSDGITQYNDSSFDGDPDPVTSHPVRKSAIRVDLNIVTGGNAPSEVNLILADNNSDCGGQYGSGGACAGIGSVDDIMNAAVTRYSIACSKSGPNTWVGYIPSDHTLMVHGTTIRFVVETKFGAGTTYADHDFESEAAPGDRTNLEWRFYVKADDTTFTPWPVRILNNVITDKNPIAYPSYYLTDDANVTIKVYDIKGRAVVTLLENAWRKGGQNIKDQGWSGLNKARRKLGVGLYYIHIKAERASDGKVILNKFKKVVIAR